MSVILSTILSILLPLLKPFADAFASLAVQQITTPPTADVVPVPDDAAAVRAEFLKRRAALEGK